jgi:thiamine phosphate synthase YjbQ (UPF0047 family)
MRIFSEEFYVSTENRRDLKNITEKVEDIVVRSGIEEGFMAG